MKPYFHYISLETRPQKLEFGRNMDSFVRYFCQEKDYRSLISGEVGLVPKIVRYWSFVIDQYFNTACIGHFDILRRSSLE